MAISSRAIVALDARAVRARGLALWVTRSDSELNARSTLTPVPKNAVAITSHILPWPSALFITDHRKRNKPSPCEYALNCGLTGYSYHLSGERHCWSKRLPGVVYSERGALDVRAVAALYRGVASTSTFRRAAKHLW